MSTAAEMGGVRPPDRRRYRAAAIAHEVMRVVRKYLETYEAYEGRYEERCHYDLLDLFMREGFDIVTDDDRRQAGLAPRGLGGWTRNELAVMEARRMEAIIAPLLPPVSWPTPVKKGGS